MSTQHRDQLNLQTKLDRVERRSRKDRRAVFNNLGHLINLDLLRMCHHNLEGRKAVGTDGMTKEVYGENLEQNLKQLLMKIRKGSYHPQASRIVEIPKADGKMRPLAISCFEDKIVQEALRMILECIYEPLFLDCSHGFRPRRGCYSALVALDKHLMSWECGAILEIDLKKYFNTIPHESIIRFLRLKIADQRFLYLIIKMLKAPIMDVDGRAVRSEVGSPQGSILSPIIANLYLHYVLDIWFSWMNETQYGGSARIVRYADDAVFVFRKLAEAENFRKQLVEHLNRFGLAINESKTKSLLSGRREALRCEHMGTNMPTFTFLGFLHLWGVSKNRRTGKRFWRVKRRTCPNVYRKKLTEIKTYVQKHRHEKYLVTRIKRVTQGHLNYFAVNDNQERVSQFKSEVEKILFKYLNRRSQRRSYNWDKFQQALRRVGFPSHVRTRNLFFQLKPH